MQYVPVNLIVEIINGFDWLLNQLYIYQEINLSTRYIMPMCHCQFFLRRKEKKLKAISFLNSLGKLNCGFCSFHLVVVWFSWSTLLIAKNFKPTLFSSSNICIVSLIGILKHLRNLILLELSFPFCNRF